jgi:hypothetical protein
MTDEMTDEQAFEPHLLFPVGTQVVLRRTITNATGEVLRQQGLVGVIIPMLFALPMVAKCR